MTEEGESDFVAIHIMKLYKSEDKQDYLRNFDVENSLVYVKIMLPLIM